MPTTARPVVLLVTDIHLSHKAPAFRSDEPNWYEAMARQLRQLNGWAKRLDIPTICGGDVFDRWNPPPELIEFALEHLPEKMYCIPGQHDLPHHNYDEMYRSAYGVLKRAGKILDLCPGIPVGVNGIFVHSFPWNHPVTPLKTGIAGSHIAVVHEYVWNDGTGYVGAEKNKRLEKRWAAYHSYDVVVAGDNHIPFNLQLDGTTFLNHGTFFKRKSDEKKHRTGAGLILETDGMLDVVILEYDTSDDIYGVPVLNKAKEALIKSEAISKAILGMTANASCLDFLTTVDENLNDDDDHAELVRTILDEER